MVGDWDHPYTTMSYPAEAQIAREIFKFVANGLLYRGSKPVMWSVVEKTALAEAEVEYEDHTSDTVYVAFPDRGPRTPRIVIWTTTPWTIPGQPRDRLLAPHRLWPLSGDGCAGRQLGQGRSDSTFLPQSLGPKRFRRREGRRLSSSRRGRTPMRSALDGLRPSAACPRLRLCRSLARRRPCDGRRGHGLRPHRAGPRARGLRALDREHAACSQERGIDTRIPYTVDENGAFTDEAPGFEGKRVITDKGEKGDANEAVIDALIEAGALVARGKLKHQYPHSWRSKKPVIFRNTPQWFLAMDRPFANARRRQDACASVAVDAIERTRWVPATGENRIKGMVANKPDWVLSRQRAWGVPLSIFVRKGGHEILFDEEVNARIADAFEAGRRRRLVRRRARRSGSSAPEARSRDLREDRRSGRSLVRFRLDPRLRARGPGPFPGTGRHPTRTVDGGRDEVMYLEGSDQHRGWFQSSLLESCGTRGRAPFDIVLTHGFTLDEKRPQDVEVARQPDLPAGRHPRIRAPTSCGCGSASVDYSDDQRIGPEILKAVSDNYRKLRNTIRWMLGTLAHREPGDAVGYAAMARARAADAAQARRTRPEGSRGLCEFRLRARRRGADRAS